MSIPKLPALEESLGFNLYRVAQLYRRELIRALADYDLTPEQWQILVALSESCDSLTQGEIAALTFKDKHSVSRMLDRMEQAGWIKRGAHPEDARASSVVLSKRRGELGEVRAVLNAHFGRIDSLLADAQQRQLLDLLKALRNRLED
jgi:DNA-binding MarR family transcriptional regulator